MVLCKKDTKPYYDGVRLSVRVIPFGQFSNACSLATGTKSPLMPGMIDAHPLLAAGDYQSSHLKQSSAYKTLLADIIAIPGNPLEGIRLLEQTSFVMLGGKIIKSPD